MPTTESSLDQKTFRKLSRLYILALSVIALAVILSQILILNYLDNQESDSTVVNIAGRQRMLSQKITKDVLFIPAVQDVQERLAVKEDLEHTLDVWTFSHQALKEGNDSIGLPGNNSPEISELFEKIDPHFREIRKATAAGIAKLEQDPALLPEELSAEISIIKQNEVLFLEGMNEIVNRYEYEAGEKLNKLGNLELLLTVFVLLLLLAEFFFIFWPAARAEKATIQKLLTAEETAKKMARDADVLGQAKENSVKELRALNQAMNQTLLFARLTPEGNIIQLGEKFSRLFKFRNFGDHGKFSELLSIQEKERKNMESIIEEYSGKGWQGEVKATTSEETAVWLEMSLIPFSPSDDKREILIIASDITARKEAQLEIERLTQKSFQEKIEQQKLIAGKIIENQENEQNRIAKDIHDGIGQMLTGLNFNLESIDVTKTEKAAQKIENLKELTGQIIKGVRTATFNLMPPELADHGIVPALTKLSLELGKLTGKNIMLYDKSGFNRRLDSLTEINIYRITQEAINNAIKYAESPNIIVSVVHSNSLLSIVIDDNGKGFDPAKIQAGEKGDGGMGMTFMKERIKYIRGRLFINSEKGKGTKVTLNIPLE